MPCYSPLTAYRAARVNPSGKRSLVFTPNSPDLGPALTDLPQVKVPCGQCIGCRLERSRRWAARCIHESQLHEQNTFITLTFDEEHYKPSLEVSDFQKFLKRFRKAIHPRKIRFFHCGEYGEENFRPHHHAIIFGYDFNDKKYYKKSGDNKLYVSEFLNKLWPYGQINPIGDVTFESAAYVARYCVKKITGKNAAEYYGDLKPPYNTMSRRPGIAHEWVKKYYRDIYNYDMLVLNGIETRPLPYYDKVYAEIKPIEFQKITSKRVKSAIDNQDKVDNLPYRLKQRHDVKMAQLNLNKRDKV